MRVAEAVREPPAAPSMTGGCFPEGGDGRARYAWVRLSALCHLPCHAEMASCWTLLFETQPCWALWFGGKGAVAVSRARSMQRRMPAIEATDRHHSMVTREFLKLERIWISVVQNSRDKD